MSGRHIGLVDTRPPGRIGKKGIANQRLHTDGLQLRFRPPVSRHGAIVKLISRGKNGTLRA